MASLGHVAVGMAAARAYRKDGATPWSSMGLWSALSLLPDIDVIGFSLGVRYGDPLGHRGATHSVLFSVGIGLSAGLAARHFKRPAGRTALFATLVLVSHGLLDTMTDGGLGCALWWPFSLARHFAPWRPIPVAPIGLAFFTPVGGAIALIELVLFSPLLLFALRPTGHRLRLAAIASFMAVWLAAVWVIASDSTPRNAIVGFALADDTVYANGFSERAFQAIGLGQSDRDVQRLLGPPLDESWYYGDPFDMAATSKIPRGCLVIRFRDARVSVALDRESCDTRGVARGMPPEQVAQRLGLPEESCWNYTTGRGSGHFRARVVCFEAGAVTLVIHRWS
jgi:inner membrane protein